MHDGGSNASRRRMRQFITSVCSKKRREQVHRSPERRREEEGLEPAGKHRRSCSGEVAMDGGATAELQTLRLAENLTLPKVQVVVMTASVGCRNCRNRVSQVIAKMNAGLLDYVVDLRKKEVVIRGIVDIERPTTMKPCDRCPGEERTKKPPTLLNSLRSEDC